MGLRARVSRFAAGGAVPTFVAIGRGGREAAETLSTDRRLLLLDSPRAASVLLLVGELTDRMLPAVMLAHDQMARPRTTVEWSLPSSRNRTGVFPALIRASEAEPVRDLQRIYRDLLTGRLASTESVYPDVPSRPWRGVGPYGQGGKGMTGGAPFGRPLAGRAPDRDGLELDQLSLEIGPLFPPFPPGLILSVLLQGDVVQEVAGWENAMVGDSVSSEEPVTAHDPGSPAPDIFFRALREPVPIARLELARARHHLRWLSRTLRLHGLPALCLRLMGMALSLSPHDAATLNALRRRLERSRSLAWATSGIAVIARGLEDAPVGVVRRAGGNPEDVRSENPAYRALGFRPITHDEGDARARWRQRLAEAVQALELAAVAGDRVSDPDGRVESPRGELGPGRTPSGALLALVPPLLAGREWGDAVSLIHDLDLDMEEALFSTDAQVA